MNRIEAAVESIHCHEGVSLVTFRAQGHPIRMLALTLPEGLETGARALLGIKATHIAVAPRQASFCGFDNRLEAVIESIERGELSVSVTGRFADTELEAIGVRERFDRTGLAEGDRAAWLFFATEVAVVEVLS